MSGKVIRVPVPEKCKTSAVYRAMKEQSRKLKHVVNGNAGDGWYCYACAFFTRDVAQAAEHDGFSEEKAKGVAT